MGKAIVMNDEEYRGVPEEWKETEAYKSLTKCMDEMHARGEAFREGMKDPNYKKPVEIQTVLDNVDKFLTSKGYEFVAEDRSNYFMIYKAVKEGLPFNFVEVETYWQSFGCCAVGFYVAADKFPQHKHSEFARHAEYDDKVKRFNVRSRKLRAIWKRDFNKAPLIQICSWLEPNKPNATEAMYNYAVEELEKNCNK